MGDSFVGVKGRLQDMSLVDIIQIFHAEKKTVAIHLGSELGYGRVYLRDGEIVHAVYRNLSGAEALYKLLAWNEGEFEVEPGATTDERTINESVDALLLEGMRRLDESRAKDEPKKFIGDMESMSLIERLIELGILEKVGRD